MNPVVFHVVRPFATEAEFLRSESWTIDARGMLLVGQRDLELDTAVVFDVTLANGTKIIRAEGRAVGYLTATAERPGGLRVRFRRFGAQTKAFIDRAIAAREHDLSSGGSSRPPEPAQEQPLPISELVGPELGRAEPRVSEKISGFIPGIRRREEPSGVHTRPVAPVVTPVNRDELLDRLRARSRNGSLPPNASAQGT